MPARSISRVTCVALVFLLSALFADPFGAFAAPASPMDASIQAKKAEEAAAKARLSGLKADLAQQVADYQALSRRMDETRQEMSAVTSEMAEQEVRLATARQQLADRAVQLYRSDSNGMLEVLLTSHSMQDFIARTEYVVLVGEADASLMSEVRLAQSQTMYLQGQLADRFARLTSEQAQAGTQRATIVAALATQKQKTVTLGQDIATLVRQKAYAGSRVASPTAGFDPRTVISEAKFRDAGCMTAADIQGFLDGKNGSLKSYTGLDVNGRTKTAAEMISDAAMRYNVSPKVILATLQKEQSLIEKPPGSPDAMDWAMGCGKGDTFTNTRYKGFGKQIDGGAQKLDSNANLWRPGWVEPIDSGSSVQPTNPGTLAQWRYTPHTDGVKSFWNLYWKYFGSPT